MLYAEKIRQKSSLLPQSAASAPQSQPTVIKTTLSIEYRQTFSGHFSWPIWYNNYVYGMYNTLTITRNPRMIESLWVDGHELYTYSVLFYIRDLNIHGVQYLMESWSPSPIHSQRHLKSCLEIVGHTHQWQSCSWANKNTEFRVAITSSRVT